MILVSLSNECGYVVPRTVDTQMGPCLRETPHVELASPRPKLPAKGIELGFAWVELVTFGNRCLLLQSAAACVFTVSVLVFKRNEGIAEWIKLLTCA